MATVLDALRGQKSVAEIRREHQVSQSLSTAAKVANNFVSVSRT